MVVFPNAKINLGLLVTEKRKDGYHNLETVFLPIALSDILEFVTLKGNKPQIMVSGIQLESDPTDNLVMRAWEIMYRKYKIPAVEIYLHKIIPAGAGLGGGSSDAAFMLKALNEYFSCGATIQELEKMALEIGSDCAFFIRNQAALAKGRGEILAPVEVPLHGLKILLVNPGIHVGTREAYAGVNPRIPETPLAELISKPVEKWQQLIVNDFERSVFANHPVIGDIKNKMITSGSDYASMSGSGSSVYGIFRENIPEELISAFRKYFTWIGELNLSV